jgi:glycosyltransferase involved in cell wall biosynthesis
MGMEDVWVVVPVFNEATTIAQVVSDLRDSFPNILCVDDGSSDGSVEIASRAGATVVRHGINLGQGAALQTGFDFVLHQEGAQWTVTFDADGQHLATDALRMVEAARRESVDVVLASRFRGATQNMPRMRRAILKAGVAFTRWTAQLDVTDTHNGLRVLSTTALRTFRLQQPRMAYASELLSAIGTHGLTYIEEPVSVIYSDYSRAKGQRNINAVNILFDLTLARLRPAP